MNSSSVGGPIVHYAKVDRWIVVMLGGGALLASALGTAFLVASLNTGEAAFLLAFTIDMAATVFVGVLIWSCYHTRYEVTTSDLIVRCGPCRTTLPLQSIVEIFPTRNPVSAPAPSLDRLQIDYRSKGWGRCFVLISPKDKEGFVRDLQRAAPQLRSVGEVPLHLKAVVLA